MYIKHRPHHHCRKDQELADWDTFISIKCPHQPKEVEVVDNFTYLGSSTNSNRDMDKELNCHTGKASAAFNQRNKIWCSKKLPLSIKLRFYNSDVLSTLLCGCEICCLKTSQERLETPLTPDASERFWASNGATSFQTKKAKQHPIIDMICKCCLNAETGSKTGVKNVFANLNPRYIYLSPSSSHHH